MDKDIICVHRLYTPALGHINTVHEKCHIVGKQGGASRYKCDCCNEEFLGGTTGVGEWEELVDQNEINYLFCTDKYESIRWYLRQILKMHHKYCRESWNYDIRMKPILETTCNIFALKKNKANFDRLIDASKGSVHKSIQELIDKDTSKQFFNINNHADK